MINVPYSNKSVNLWEQLLNYVRKNNLKGLSDFFQANPNAHLEVDPIFRANLLHWACIEIKPNIVDFLLTNYPQLNQQLSTQARYPLHYACRHGIQKIVERLLEQKTTSQQIHARDHDGNTPFLLAAYKNHPICIRLLLNSRYSNLISDEDIITAIFHTIKYIFLDIAEFLIEKLRQRREADQLNENLANLRIHQAPSSIIPLPTPTVNNPDAVTLKLIALFLLQEKLGRWLILRQGAEVAQYENRDETLLEDEQIARLQKETRERRLSAIRNAINILLPEVQCLNSAQLKSYYQSAVMLRKCYFDDYSDDSDSEDEAQFSQRQNLSARVKQHQEIQQITSSTLMPFWYKSHRQRKGGGLLEKLEKLNNSMKRSGMTKAEVKKITSDVFDEKRKRETIKPPLSNKPKRFIAQFRGINYMHDRWGTEARRYHYKMDETGYTQFSEAVLKTLPYDFYKELTRENDFYRNPEHYKALIATAQRIRQLYYGLSNTQGHIVENASAPTVAPYLFNGVTDWMQHEFTNGISQHLLNIKHYRRQKKHQLDQFTLNSFNYAISTSDCPNHALRYALGLKKYYADNFDLHYNADGSITNTHAGKVYIILQEFNEFLTPGSLNRVLQMAYEGRVPIIKTGGGDIANELENDYIGYIPGEKVAYQQRLKFPSFHKPYKPIYEVKYGMNERLYELFGYFIKVTWRIENRGPNNELHMEVLQLLKEWLCCYYEVLLLEVAQRQASSLGGSLVYLDHENSQKQSPDFVPFNGGDAHMHHRNQVHLLQNFRYIAARFPEEERTKIDNMIDNILRDPTNLLELVKGVKFKPAGVGGAEKIPDPQDKAFYRENATCPEIEKDLSRYILKKYRQTLDRNNIVENTPYVINPSEENYLYTDVDINIILNQSLNQADISLTAPVSILTAQHPFVQGFHGPASMGLFEETIRKCLQKNTFALLPINTTEEQSSTYQPVTMRGTHWVGIMFKPGENNQITVEYSDPAPPNNVLIQRIGEILSRISREVNKQINFQHLPTEQQLADVDCGPWVVDNLVRRAQNLPVRSRNEITGLNLRLEQHKLYQDGITAYSRKKFG